jgi:Family of unknown function (DUF6529)
MAANVRVRAQPNPRARLAAILVIGAAVALGLGVYGNVHDPTGRSLITLFFTATINLKAWLATAAIALALFQVVSGPRILGRLGRGTGPAWLPTAHRVSGTLAFLLTIPVAYHCLWALGFHADEGTRILVHGIAGCFFFGALTSKVLFVRTRRKPRWVLPVAGGAVFTALVVVWLSSAFWFFRTNGFPKF